MMAKIINIYETGNKKQRRLKMRCSLRSTFMLTACIGSLFSYLLKKNQTFFGNKREDFFPKKILSVKYVPIIQNDFINSIISRKYSFALAGIILLGFVLRIWNVDKSSYFVDEAFSFFAADGILKSFSPVMPNNTLYKRAIFNHLFMAIPLYFIENDELATRVVSVLFGCASILTTYYLTKKVSTEKHALIASFLLSVSILSISWDRYGRMYSMLEFLTVAFIFFFVSWLQNRNVKYIVYMALILIISIFTSQQFLLIPFLSLFILAYYIKKDNLYAQLFNKRIFFVLLGTICLFVLYILIFDKRFFSFFDIITGQRVPSWASEQPIFWYFFQFLEINPLLSLFFFISIISITFIKVDKTLLKSCYFYYLSGIILVGIIINFGNSTRYAYYLYPLFIICASWSLDLLGRIKYGNIILILTLLTIALSSVNPLTSFVIQGENTYNPIINIGYNKWNEIDFIEETSVIATSNLILTYKYIGAPTYSVFTKPSTDYINATYLEVEDTKDIHVDYYILDYRAKKDDAEYNKLVSNLRELGYKEINGYKPIEIYYLPK